MTLTEDLGIDPALSTHRGELTGYCYRMLGSVHDAEDAVQETLVRAWRHKDGFEGRSSVRSWLYRIATNVCIDAIGSRSRRARRSRTRSPHSSRTWLSSPHSGAGDAPAGGGGA